MLAFLEKNKKPALIAITILTAALFFAVAFSTANDWLKLLFSVLILSVGGSLLGRLSGHEQHYGFIILRGVMGFKEMKYVGKNYGRLSREIADWGLTLGFGIPYGIKNFGLSRRLLVQAVVSLVFFAIVFFQNAAGGVDGNWIIVLGALAGLFGVGFFFLAQHAFSILTIPGTPAGVIPIVPGVTVPWEVVFALIIVAAVHELAHGVICAIEKLEVKSSGVLLFGILPIGAFVEPDEKKMAKLNIEKQKRILVAGSASNAVFFLLFLVLSLGAAMLVPLMVDGVSVKTVDVGSTAALVFAQGEKIISVNGQAVKVAEDLNKPKAGDLLFTTSSGSKTARAWDLIVLSSANPALQKGDVLVSVDGEKVYDHLSLKAVLDKKTGGQTVAVETSSGTKNAVLNSDGKIGVTVSLKQAVVFQNDSQHPFFLGLLYFVIVVLVYTYTLNFILAMVNLLPLFMTDGHKIIYLDLVDWFGKDAGSKLTLGMGIIALGLVVLNALPLL